MVNAIDDDYIDFLLREAKWFKTTTQENIIKLMEEVGEVAAAYIGTTGTNPRKGITHRERDVVDELADVANTALLAIVQLGFDPNHVLDKQREKAEGYMDALARVPEPRS
jgi:NTP pyrophosphatase (non-canonical NTP hydrolase)